MADTNPFQSFGQEWFNAWLKGAGDFWTMAAGMATAAPAAEKGRFADAVDATRRTFQAAVGQAGTDPAAWNLFAKTFETMPQLCARLFQNTVDGYLELGRRWNRHLETVGRTAAKPFDFNDLDKDFIRRWTDIYKEEFQRLFQIPQLGPGKFFQEKVQSLIDAANVAQAAGVEFAQLLLVPVEKAVRVLQTQLADLAEKGDLPQDPRAVYGLWIKTLEGHFMTLFKSPQYAEALARTLEAANRLVMARQGVSEVWLRQFPAPTLKDMDELAHDVYVLKKRVRDLEAALAAKTGKG